MRPCPRCSYPTQPLDNGSVELDHCPRCKGNFFLPGEMAKSFGADAEPEHWLASKLARDLGPSKLKCPYKHGAMQAHELAFDGLEVEVDVCRTCGGQWLDSGEVGRVIEILQRGEQARDAGNTKPNLGTYLLQLFSGFPVEVYNPVRKRPVLVFALLGLLASVYFVEELLLKVGGQQFIQSFALVPARFLAGEAPWTLGTYAFLHASTLHLVGNLYFLYVFGDNVEDTLGRRRFVVLYLLAGLAGGVLHLLVQPGSTTPMLGASGAIAGVLGAYLVLFPKVKLWIVFFFARLKIGAMLYLSLWLGFQLAMAQLGGAGVAWYAHIGGFAIGALVAVALRPRPQPIPVRATDGAQ